MSNVSLFIVGTLITLIVTAAMGLLVWGAILDGRTQRAVDRAQEETARQRDERRQHAA